MYKNETTIQTTNATLHYTNMFANATTSSPPQNVALLSMNWPTFFDTSWVASFTPELILSWQTKFARNCLNSSSYLLCSLCTRGSLDCKWHTAIQQWEDCLVKGQHEKRLLVKKNLFNNSLHPLHTIICQCLLLTEGMPYLSNASILLLIHIVVYKDVVHFFLVIHPVSSCREAIIEHLVTVP